LVFIRSSSIGFDPRQKHPLAGIVPEESTGKNGN